MPVPNGVMMQCFHWHSSPHGTLWAELASSAKDLARAGFTAVWLPPACKGTAGADDVGYGAYDTYDLGEFDQKGSVRTRYGTRKQYLAAVKALHRAGLEAYADAVLGHRMGGDSTEMVRATPFAQGDWRRPKGEPREIEAYTHFHFPGRRGKHSPFEWRARHFDAVDYDHRKPDDRDTAYLLDGKRFDEEGEADPGERPYVLGADPDFRDEEVRRELTAWGRWYLDTTGVDGFRLDAVRRTSASFFTRWLDDLERHVRRELFVVAECPAPDVSALRRCLERLGGRITAFATPLHHHLHHASRAGGGYDLRRLLDATLVRQLTRDLVTYVENHDSQPLRPFESVVEPWFKPLAYAITLLRRDGYPCVFEPDYHGADYEARGGDGERHRVAMPSHRWLIDKFLHARRQWAWGPQIDYLDHWNRVGWVRLGDERHPRAMAVLMSDSHGGTKWMEVGRANARFTDVTEHVKEPVVTNEAGWGEFRCLGGSVSVWVQE